MNRYFAITIPLGIVFMTCLTSLAQETISVPIQLRGYERAEIVSRLQGFVDEVMVDIGDTVTEGQVLIRLRIPEINAELNRRQKMVAKARADYESQEADVAASRAKLEALEAVEKLKAKQLQRYQRLVGSGALRQEKLDEAEFAHASAQADLKSLEAEVLAAEAHLHGAEAAIDVALAEEKKAEVMVGYLELKAPFDGEIMRRDVDRGDLVQLPPGPEHPLLILVRTDRLRGLMMVMSDDANRIQEGQAVEIQYIRGLPEQKIHSTVSRLARSLAEAAQMMRVEIDLDNPVAENGHRRLKPGDYGKAIVSLPDER